LPGVKPSTTAAGAHASASSAVRRGGIWGAEIEDYYLTTDESGRDRAVEDVADAMGVSRITVYNYLNSLHR
jgi:hypothetical protein